MRELYSSFWFIFHPLLIMYSAIYVLFITRRVHIFALKLSFWNINHTCPILFDTLIMKREAFFCSSWTHTHANIYRFVNFFCCLSMTIRVYSVLFCLLFFVSFSVVSHRLWYYILHMHLYGRVAQPYICFVCLFQRCIEIYVLEMYV